MENPHTFPPSPTSHQNYETYEKIPNLHEGILNIRHSNVDVLEHSIMTTYISSDDKNILYLGETFSVPKTAQ
jgi:hypothetical protein